jgi:hypothetical protein
MGQRSSKAQQGAVTPISIRFDGGLNYSESPTKIADNELCRALNFIYNSQSGLPEVRPGTACMTATPLGAPILKIYYYEKSTADKWLVCASGGKLYKLVSDAWVEIGNLNDSTTVPSFQTFNTHLLIADGGTNIKKWDGTTLGSLSDGLSATAIAEVGGRVVINSKSDPDLVTFSGMEDETQWDTADLTNPAIGLRAGFGDNMIVNGFSVFNADLLISKRGDSEKRFYRINTSGVPTAWTVEKLTSNNASQNAHTLVSAFNNVFFVDNNGFKSIKGVTEYGDLQIDMVGAKVNTQFALSVCDEVSYLPMFTAIWFLIIDRVYAYHRIYDADGNLKHAFTDMQFKQGRITSVLQAGNTVYMAGYNGYLYKIDDSRTTDETAPNVNVTFPSLIVSKRFSFFGGGILRKTSVELKALEVTGDTSVYLRANTAEVDGALLKTISILSGAQGLDTATGDLADATLLLGDMSGSAWIETCSNRVRGTSIQFQMDSQSGRFGLEGLQAEVALVGS